MERFPAKMVERKQGVVARAILASMRVKGDDILFEAHPLTPSEQIPSLGESIFVLFDSSKSDCARYQLPRS